MYTSEQQALVERGMQGDGAAIAALCEAKWLDILYLCIKLMGNKADGEDAAQEVMIKLQQSLPRLKKAKTFPAWLNRMVTNTCTDLHRKRTRTPGIVPLEDCEDLLLEENAALLPAEQTELQDRRQLLLAAVDALPYNYRTVVLLFYYEELPIKQIALALQTSENNVKITLYRARQRLQKSLTAKEESPQRMESALPLALLTAALGDEAGKLATPLPDASPATPGHSAPKAGAGKKAGRGMNGLLLAAALLALAGAVAAGTHLGDAPASYSVVSTAAAERDPQPAGGQSPGTAGREAGESTIQAAGENTGALIRGTVCRQGEDDPFPGAAGLTVCVFQNGACVIETLVDTEGRFVFHHPPIDAGVPLVLKLQPQYGIRAAGAAETGDIALAMEDLPATVSFTVVLES